jgi:hypothetical protein
LQSLIEIRAHRVGSTGYPRYEAEIAQRERFFALVSAGPGEGKRLTGQGGHIRE